MARFKGEIPRRALHPSLKAIFDEIAERKVAIGLVVCNDHSGGRLVAVSEKDCPFPDMSKSLYAVTDLLKDEDGVALAKPLTNEELKNLLQGLANGMDNTSKGASQKPLREPDDGDSFNETIFNNPGSLSGYTDAEHTFTAGDTGFGSYQNLTPAGVDKLKVIFAAAGLRDHIFTTPVGLSVQNHKGKVIDDDDIKLLLQQSKSTAREA